VVDGASRKAFGVADLPNSDFVRSDILFDIWEAYLLLLQQVDRLER